MKTLAKAALVVLGYVAAWLIADAAVAIHVALTARDSQGADGMYAFGDSLLFLGVFGLIALIPTGAAVYFLKASKSLWTGLSAIAPVIGATAPVAVLLFAALHRVTPGGILASLSVLALLRLLASPLLCAFFFVCGVLAPTPALRKRLFVAGGLDAVAVICIVLFWFFARH